MYLPFDQLPDSARIWIFQSHHYIPFEKAESLSGKLMNFLENWQAHGQALKASFTLRYDRFIIIALDEASYRATGCSIDKLTHQIAALEEQCELELLNRSLISYRDDNGMISVLPMQEFRQALEEGELDASTIVFNNLIETKGQLLAHWELPLGQSWHQQWLPIA